MEIVRNLQYRAMEVATSRIARIASNPEHQRAIKIGVAAGALMASGVASATGTTGTKGWAQAFGNMTEVGKLIIDFVVVIGMVVGLGYVLGGLFSAYKKYDRGNEDITWGKIATQVGVGGGAMALSFIAKLVVQTLGGDAENMGAKVNSLTSH